MTILLCNNRDSEIEKIKRCLSPSYEIAIMRSWNGKPIDANGIDAIILDEDFNYYQGLDLLMNVASSTYIPIMVLCKPDDPQYAIEAKRLGAFNYCIKTDKLYDVLNLVISDMIFTFNDQQELKHTLISQKTYIEELEAQLKKERNNEEVKNNIPANKSDTNQKPRSEILQKIIHQINKGEINIPTFPAITREVGQLINSDAEIKEIALLLEKDISICTKLITVANSPRYVSVKKCTSVEQAIHIIGLNITAQYVDILANRSLYTISNSKYNSILKDLWLHGAACAQASFLLAQEIKLYNPKEIFFWGLIHDVGKLFLLQIISQLQNNQLIDNSELTISLENFLFQYHASFGRKLLEIWKFSSEAIIIAKYHEFPKKCLSYSSALFCVALGDLLAIKAGYGNFHSLKEESLINEYNKTLRVESEKIEEIIKKVKIFIEDSELKLN